MSQIIDFERKGNLIRFYTGKNGQQCGDDWNDAPYDCNAGVVYDKYVDGHYDLCVPFDWTVVEPCDGFLDGYWSKKDMVERRVACLIIVPPSLDGLCTESFLKLTAVDGVIRIYFGDDPKQISKNWLSEVVKQIKMPKKCKEAGRSIGYDVF